MKRIAFYIVLGLLLAPPSLASAESGFDQVLRAIDTVPTREALDAAFDDAPAQLRAAALDSTRSTYQRHRAITLLSLYPTAENREFLTKLAANRTESAEIRKMSVYTLGRVFGANPHDEALVATLRGFVYDDDTLVREWAVRSLRWVASPGAEALLREVLASDDTELHRIARRALSKRLPLEKQGSEKSR